jgi:hypothetical protein
MMGRSVKLLAVAALLLATAGCGARWSDDQRAEVRVVFEELFTRLGDIRVPDGTIPERGDSSLVLSLAHLPAVFTPEPAP